MAPSSAPVARRVLDSPATSPCVKYESPRKDGRKRCCVRDASERKDCVDVVFRFVFVSPRRPLVCPDCSSLLHFLSTHYERVPSVLQGRR